MRVVLCDDNAKEREYFSNLTKAIAEQSNIFIDFSVYESAENLLFELEDEIEKIDVFLLDINMPKLSGMELAVKLRERGFNGEIVFLTVSKEHILNAFDVRAFNYIVKGETSLEKTQNIISDVLKLCKEKSEEYILFTGIGEYRNIAISSIKYFEIKGKIVTVYYGAGKSFEFISTMTKLENLLYAKNFIRVHKSFLVSTLAIANHSFKEVVLKDGTTIPLGRTYYADIKKILSIGIFICLSAISFLLNKPSFAKENRYKISIEKRPSEKETGLRKYIDEDTGEVHYEIIEATGHIWSEWKVEKEATVSEEGLMYRVCTKYPDHPHYEYMKIPPLQAIDKGQEETRLGIGSEMGSTKAEKVVVEDSYVPRDEKTVLEEKDNTENIKQDIESVNNNIEKTEKVYNSVLLTVIDVGLATVGLIFVFWFVIILVPMIMALIWINRKKREARDRMRK